MIDGDEDKGWETEHLQRGQLRQLKQGMGVWIDLGAPHTVKSRQVDPVGRRRLRRSCSPAPADPPSSSQGDKQTLSGYKTRDRRSRSRTTTAPRWPSTASTPTQKYQYLLFWITELPVRPSGGFKLGVQEITVQGS